MPARRIVYDEGGKALYVNGKPFPLHILEGLAELKPGQEATVKRGIDTITVDWKLGETTAPRCKGDATKKEKAFKGKLSVKKMNVIWPPDKANVAFPDHLKVEGKLPSEPLDEEQED